MVLKLSKKSLFSKFCADLSKKPKSVKAIYVNTLKVLITLYGLYWCEPPFIKYMQLKYQETC